jgi:hypothetical protein
VNFTAEAASAYWHWPDAPLHDPPAMHICPEGVHDGMMKSGSQQLPAPHGEPSSEQMSGMPPSKPGMPPPKPPPAPPPVAPPPTHTPASRLHVAEPWQLVHAAPAAPDPHCAEVNMLLSRHVLPSQQPFAQLVALHEPAPTHAPFVHA